MQKEKYIARVETKPNDMVNHPSHYKAGDLECFEVMLQLYGREAMMAFCMCNAFKYQWRCNKKGNLNQDLEKAIFYNKKFLELAENE